MRCEQLEAVLGMDCKSALTAAVSVPLLALAGETEGATEEMGQGFRHHGVATPVSNHRGTVATIDGDGRNVVLVWLFDHRGGYALLLMSVPVRGGESSAPEPDVPASRWQVWRSHQSCWRHWLC